MSMKEIEAIRSPYSVSELTNEIRLLLEESYDWVQVRGEISNYKKAPSGHAYFRLKDENAIIECVAWKSTVIRWAGLELKDGQEIIAGGRISLYPPRGQYQLVVSSLRMAGLGALQQQFEALKRRLASEGLFDSEKKKPLPTFPQKIALITSPTGAAVRDFIKIVRRGRCPVQITVCPVLVQGIEAAREISQMIERINRMERHDLIVLCRGGGSLEDLWSFNEEAVARAIFSSEIPVLTGIGHEIDYTIADFTADMRAPTPTGAAQLICELFEQHRGELKYYRDRLLRSFQPKIERLREWLEVIKKALRRYHPSTIILQKQQRLDEIQLYLSKYMKSALEEKNARIQNNKKILQNSMIHALESQKKDLQNAQYLLHSYDPARILERGYAICRDEKGNIISTIADVSIDKTVQIQLCRGWFRSRVTEVQYNHGEKK